jgi:iron complex outermembrane receptor protein
VLKDGASAIYGSDAVAGVVNFILIGGPGEAPYEGAEIDMLYGNTTDTDARVLQAWIRGGAFDGQGVRRSRRLSTTIARAIFCARS